MSFSAANMCRFVIVFIFISFASCVLAKGGTPDSKKNDTKCRNIPEVKESSKMLTICLNNTVARHLDPSIVLKSGECQNVTDFGKKLNNHFITMNKYCNSTIYNSTDFIKLVDFSLRNGSFKDFYADISCVKNLELNISNTCVKGNVGNFNITRERTHTRWYRKATLYYSGDTCATTNQVKNCVERTLKTCQNKTREYFTSLFNYARELGDCTRLEENMTSAYGANVPVPAASVLTIPVIITLSIGAVVVVAAIIIIIVMKSKH